MNTTDTLLFDAGNSRLKWALVRDGRLGRQRARPRGDMAEFAHWLRDAPAFERTVGVNVAGPRFARQLREALRTAGRPAPEFITSSVEAAGVLNGYKRPLQLGPDRWAAMVAAWHRAGGYRTVCAASIGTAITLDLVDQDGYHRGGLIAPGPAMMLDGLLGRTAEIAARAVVPAMPRRRRPPPEHQLVPPLAETTLDAVEEGCLAAAAGFIDRTVNQLSRRLHGRPVLFVTGGASGPVIQRLRSACRPCDDLVLRGVAVLADVPIRRRA